MSRKSTVADPPANEERAKSRKRPIESKRLPEKEFELRNSLLIDLFDNNPHIKTIYHIFIAILLCLFVNTAVHDYLRKGEIKVGFHLIYLSFRKLHIVALFWFMFLLATCSCYYFFILWSKVRTGFSPKSKLIKIWDLSWVLFLIGYYLASFRAASAVVTTFQLPTASASIILLEQIRFTMKIHAFIRSNTPRVTSYKTHSDQHMTLPSFGKFFYFLFAPTLIYRDQYPRTNTIRWNFVVTRALEILGVIVYYSFLLHRFLLPIYEDFCIRKYTRNEIILSIFENAIVGILLFVLSFFLVLHSIQNLVGELLRFGDRMFYKDWWTCTSYSEYFRVWNIIVYDWLYQYVYKDMYEIVMPKNKIAGKFVVVILSCVVHEWILTNMFGFFLPALFIAFFFGAGCMSFITTPKKTIVNVLFWYELIFGSGGLVSMYTLEYFARCNSPVANPSWRLHFAEVLNLRLYSVRNKSFGTKNRCFISICAKLSTRFLKWPCK